MAASTARTEVPGGHAPFPPFEREFFASQLVWLGLTFVLLYVLMAKVALPRLRSILESRDKRIAADLTAAEQLKNQSDAADAAYVKEIDDARGRAQVVVGTARDKQAVAAAAVRDQLEAKLNKQIREAENSIAAARTAAMTNLRTIAVDAASAIVERLAGRKPAEEDVAAAVADVLKS